MSAKNSPKPNEPLRAKVRGLLAAGELGTGDQAQLAEMFNVSRQRVHQIVLDEKRLAAERERIRNARVEPCSCGAASNEELRGDQIEERLRSARY